MTEIVESMSTLSLSYTRYLPNLRLKNDDAISCPSAAGLYEFIATMATV